MIDKKELRSGNFVNVPHGDVQIDYLIKEGVHLVDGCGGTWQSLEPIPLSPEWLERLGADSVTENEDGSQNYWSRDNDFSIDVETHILVQKLEMLFYYRIDGGLRGRRLSIVHLHQLQNLYFALTSKELELKQ